MFKKLNQYLLTHHPLLWNTRVLPMLAIIALLHGCFFVGGYASVTTAILRESQYRVVFNEEMLFFSILCSIAVLVLWLVFYLRNNAFKSFYRLGKGHLAKELGLILLIVLTSISFIESFGYGVRVKGRRITPYNTLVQEVNTVNLAMAFVPIEKEDYFILNDCKDYKDDRYRPYHSNYDYSDTSHYDDDDKNIFMVKRALRQPNALSYQHYCATSIELYDTTRFLRSTAIHRQVNDWLRQQRQDSVKATLERLVAVCKKYNIEYNLNLSELTALPFGNPNNRITQTVKSYPHDYSHGSNTPYFIRIDDLTQTLNTLDDYHSPARNDDYWGQCLVLLYVTLWVGLLIWAYRRFSKKVSLIGLIGGVVWCIVLGLTAAVVHDVSSVGILFTVLFLLFTTVGWVGLRGRHKTITGVLLNWHAVMLPALFLIIAAIMTDHYHQAHYVGVAGYDSELHCRRYPISCWVKNNFYLIAWVNIGFSLLYSAFVLNPLVKRWHEMTEE